MASAHSQRRDFGEILNTWVQTIGICIAAIWGVYTFVFKEILVPKSAPVNVTINLQLKKIGTGPTNGNLTAVEMKISATNPSSRKVYLLPSVWVAHGIRIKAVERDDAGFADATVKSFQDSTTVYSVQRHVE